MVIYHYVKRIGEFPLPPIFLHNIYEHERYYPVEPVNMHMQSFINIIQENNRVITTKKGKGKLPLFNGNIERVIVVYAFHHHHP